MLVSYLRIFFAVWQIHCGAMQNTSYWLE